nr:hypothetical protein CFP56_52211 [Quercus suber]
MTCRCEQASRTRDLLAKNAWQLSRAVSIQLTLLDFRCLIRDKRPRAQRGCGALNRCDGVSDDHEPQLISNAVLVLTVPHTTMCFSAPGSSAITPYIMQHYHHHDNSSYAPPLPPSAERTFQPPGQYNALEPPYGDQYTQAPRQDDGFVQPQYPPPQYYQAPQPHAGSAYGPQLSGPNSTYPAHMVSAHRDNSPWPLNLPGNSMIAFDFIQVEIDQDRKDRRKARDTHTYALCEPGASPSNPYYDSTFAPGPDDRSRSHPFTLKMLRNQMEVCKATFTNKGNDVEMQHPWTARGLRSPESEWRSDTDTLPGVSFVWDYDGADHSSRHRHAEEVIRCHVSHDDRTEICRVTFTGHGQTDRRRTRGEDKHRQGRIEIPAGIIRSQQGLDEMVSHACVHLHRRCMGWDSTSRKERGERVVRIIKIAHGLGGLGGN